MRARLSIALLLVLVCGTAFAGHRFHASALALGGEGRASIGATALASAGGEGRNYIRDYDDGVVRFAEATTIVRGSHEGDVAVTFAEVVVRDVNIAGRIQADRLVARLHERHLPGATEPEFSFEGSAIENLRIDGVPVDASLDNGYFSSRPTFEMMTADAMPSRAGVIVCSARGTASCGSERQASRGIEIPGLGVLTIGEVFVRNAHRQVNLLRLDLGRGSSQRDGKRIRANGNGGTIVVAGYEGNGTPIWP